MNDEERAILGQISQGDRLLAIAGYAVGNPFVAFGMFRLDSGLEVPRSVGYALLQRRWVRLVENLPDGVQRFEISKDGQTALGGQI